jgi:hypothetical protein
MHNPRTTTNFSGEKHLRSEADASLAVAQYLDQQKYTPQLNYHSSS